jgi:hypothetical protein
MSNGEPNDARELREDIRSGERWLIGLGIATVVINSAIALIYLGQLRQMRKATAASRDAANAATSAATTADQTLKHMVATDKATSDAALVAFKEEERAYVSVSTAQMSNPPTCSFPQVNGLRVCADIHFVNTGKTPAVNIRTTRFATFGKNAEAIIKGLKVPSRSVPNGDLLGNSGDKWVTAPTDPVDQDTAKKLIESSEPLYI